MKKIAALLLLCTIILVSCNKKIDEPKAEYKTDVKVSEIADKYVEILDNPALTAVDEGWVALNLEIDTTLCEEYVVYLNTTGASDLFGIFKATSEENADKLLEQSQKHLVQMKENWMSEYLPEEFPKIENAECQKTGLYVTFLVLDDVQRTDCASAFENAIKITETKDA